MAALPGIQRSQRLEAKDDAGVVAPFEVDGVSWIDGSIQADVPFKRMATLFNVSNFIVAQVNFHVKLVVEDSASRLADTNPANPYSLRRHYTRILGAAEGKLRAAMSQVHDHDHAGCTSVIRHSRKNDLFCVR